MAHPASRASTEPAGVSGSPASAAFAQQPADLAALTGRDDFLLELGELLGGNASVHPADSLDAALERLSEARGRQVLVIDSRGTGDVRANVARASQQTPEAVILVFTESHSETDVAAALKGSKVFAVLPIPMAAAKTAAVLEAALTHAGRDAAAGMGHRHPASDPATRTTATDSEAAAAQPQMPEPPMRRGLLWTGVGAAVLALAVGAGWYLLRAGTTAPTAPKAAPGGRAGASPSHAAAPAQPSVDTSIVRGRVDDLLENARRAMFQRHFTSPEGANALVYYRSVLAVDPSNGEALDGLRRVGNVLISRFKDAMRRTQYPQAALALATLKLARPRDPRIASFQRRLYEAEITQALASGHPGQTKQLLTQAARAGIPAAQMRAWQSQLKQARQNKRLQSMAASISRDIDADDLTGQTGALATLAQLRAQAPTSTLAQQAAQTVIAGLLAKAARDAQAGKTAQEGRWLDQARSIGASAGDIAAFKQRLAAARTQAAQAKMNSLLAQAHARLASGALLRPRNDSAAYYLTALQQTHPTGAVLAAEQQARGELAAKLLERAESEARAGKSTAAHNDVAQARMWGAGAAAIGSAGNAIASSLRRSEQPTAAELRRLAASLVRTRYVAPSYPDSALSQRISGQVIVGYVVGKRGIPRHVHVISAQPAGVFERATVDAIRAWRYRPAKFHGHPVEVPVRTRIRFELPN